MLKNEVIVSEENAFIFFGPKEFIASDGPLSEITRMLATDTINPNFQGD